MKVGIVTYHNAHNYGAMLQVYALQNIISEMGYENEVIDFRPYHENLNTIQKLKVVAKKIMTKLPNIFSANFLGGSIERYKSFDQFMNNQLILSKEKYNTISKLYVKSLDYDSYITGSDQVWNPEISGESMEAYFLSFVKGKGKRKIAYAASFGSPKIVETYSYAIAPYLKMFDYISVREDDVVESTKSLSGKNVIATVDPTILLKRDCWLNISKAPKEQGYVLVYVLEQNEETVSIVNSIIRSLGLKAINFSTNLVFENEEKKAITAGPEEFLGYFQNAEFIVTNSFHGTIFSILFQKKFYSILPKERSSRIYSLLTKLDLSDRMIQIKNSSLNTLEDNKIDYDKVEKLLDIERKKSLDFLRRALS